MAYANSVTFFGWQGLDARNVAKELGLQIKRFEEYDDSSDDSTDDPDDYTEEKFSVHGQTLYAGWMRSGLMYDKSPKFYLCVERIITQSASGADFDCRYMSIEEVQSAINSLEIIRGKYPDLPAPSLRVITIADEK